MCARQRKEFLGTFGKEEGDCIEGRFNKYRNKSFPGERSIGLGGGGGVMKRTWGRVNGRKNGSSSE